MTKVVVASFKDERKAMEAFKKLNDLESFGDISLYDKIIVRKMKNGDFETLKADSSEGWRAWGGMVAGGLLGAIGGPIGFIIGLYAGTAIGGISEINHYDFAKEFIEKIERRVAAGTISIIAEMDEEDKEFIDVALKPFGAVILRSNVDYAYDDYMHQQLDEVEDDIAEQRAGLKNSIGKEKEKIKNIIVALKEKRKEKISEFDAELKNASSDIKDKTVSGIASIKKEAKIVDKQVKDIVVDAKSNRIKRSIARHEAKLKSLQHDLEVLA
jgi:uncharacterized membrane protein